LPAVFDQAFEANNARVLRARQIIRPFQKSALGHRLVYTRVDLARDSFILYAGDSAPHHHSLVLLRALKQYNSTQSQPLILVLRRQLISFPMIEHWLDREGPELAPYVVGLDDEAPLTWAALNVLARCAVDPSLFAPSFPRTFAEALSAWTPILMSDIPAVTNVIQDPALRKDMLFDPYDFRALADRLDWVLKNRDDLARRQRDVFELIPTWGEVGDRVFEMMVEVAEKKDHVQ
jgi:glycosyltransferase involved in cell wall biosynthesis